METEITSFHEANFIFVFRLLVYYAITKMSKRKASDVDDGEKRHKYSDLTGFSKDVTPARLKKLRNHPHKGDWRRDRVIRTPYKFCIITWTNTVTDNEFLIKTPVPCGMTGLIVKLQTASCRCWESLPVSVKNHFGLFRYLTKSINFLH